MVAQPPSKSATPRIVVALLVGGLVGFSAGYFAGGGGRPGRGATDGSPRSGERAADPQLRELNEAVDRDPENPALLTALGNYRYDREEWKSAIAAYEKARRKASNDPNLLSDLGAAHRNAGEFELAVAYFQKARAADPEHWQSLLNWTLVEAYDRRNAAEAQRLLDEVKRRFPEIPQLDRIQAQISSLRAGA